MQTVRIQQSGQARIRATPPSFTRRFQVIDGGKANAPVTPAVTDKENNMAVSAHGTLLKMGDGHCQPRRSPRLRRWATFQAGPVARHA